MIPSDIASLIDAAQLYELPQSLIVVKPCRRYSLAKSSAPKMIFPAVMH